MNRGNTPQTRLLGAVTGAEHVEWNSSFQNSFQITWRNNVYINADFFVCHSHFNSSSFKIFPKLMLKKQGIVIFHCTCVARIYVMLLRLMWQRFHKFIINLCYVQLLRKKVITCTSYPIVVYYQFKLTLHLFRMGRSVGGEADLYAPFPWLVFCFILC